MAHEKQFEFLRGKFKAGQLGHAYIFFGQEGIGKKEFAKEFIKLVNANIIANPDLAIQKEQFPDLLIINSINSESSVKNEKDMMEIDIGQIREVNNFLSLTSYYGGYKAVIIENAERLSPQAQHCFLKTLEEPKGKTIIIFICKKPELLLSTITSRCQSIAFFSPGKYMPNSQQQQVLEELLPILDSGLATKFNFAKKVNLDGNNFQVILKVLQRHFRDLMLANIGVINQDKKYQKSGKGLDSRAEPRSESKALYYRAELTMGQVRKIIGLIETLHRQTSLANINQKLALEILLLEL